MKRAAYGFAIAWIAVNDGSGDEHALEVESVSEQVTVLLVADLFGVKPLTVARDVIKLRVSSDSK